MTSRTKGFPTICFGVLEISGTSSKSCENAVNGHTRDCFQQVVSSGERLYVGLTKFKVETVTSVLIFTRGGDVILSMDLRDAYF